MKLVKRIFIGLVVIIIIGAVFASTQKDDKKSANNIDNTSAVKEEAKKVNKVGETFKIGDVEYLISSVKTQSEVGNKYLNKKAQGTFLLIEISITNKSSKSLSVSDSYYKLLLGDKEYETSTDASIYLGEKSLLYKEINPDVKLSGVLAFDINKDVASNPELQLQLQTGIFGTEKDTVYLNK